MGKPPALGIASCAHFVTALVDTSVLIDYPCGHEGAAAVLERERAAAPLHASEISRLEVLAGMRAPEEDATHSLPATLTDLAIAATGTRTGSHLLTRNVRQFPMFPALAAKQRMTDRRRR